MKRKLIAGLLTFMMALQASSYAAEGDMISSEADITMQEETESAETEHVIPELNYHGEDDPVITSIEENMVQNDTFSVERQTMVLPASYVSSYVTSVKNQNPYGTCWAHAAVASAEASLVKKNLATADVDLSEYQLSYFMSHTVTDSLGGIAGDSFSTVDNYLDAGGNQSIATLHLATWQGLTLESDAMYSDASVDSTLEDDYAYDKDVAHLENAYWISMKDQDLVKAAIMEYGVAASSYYSASAYYSTTNYWNTSTPVAEYCPSSKTTSTNHAITIVGWDDTYSKDNFGTYKPNSDGAWYCKNSWGDNWSKDGYFWISYEDGPLSNGTAYFYDFGTADNYDYNYQYDGCVTHAYYSGYYSREANVFTATSTQLLKAVGFFTYDSQYQCNVKVYKNCGTNTPEGTLVAEQQADQLYAGYHTVVLDTPVSLEQGDTFSVVVEQTTSSGGAPVLVFEYTQNASWYTSTASAKAGQSYMSTSSGGWYDVGASKNGNVRVKAYTVDYTESTPVLVTSVSLSPSSVNLEVGETTTISATVEPSNATNSAVIWTSDNTSVAMVDSDGNVTAKATGTATITCSSIDGSGISAVATITVTKKMNVTEWPFKDVVVKDGNWKYESVKYVYEHGYMTGTRQDMFSPDQSLTRGMVVTILYRMAGEPDVTDTVNYSDVDPSKYYAKPIAWATQEGIATGYKNGTFGAEKNISRQELAKMICQFAKQQGYNTEYSADISNYVDYSKVKDYAVPYMSWAVATGIITGKNQSGKLYLDPQGEATRAECAAILKRYEEFYVNDIQ